MAVQFSLIIKCLHAFGSLAYRDVETTGGRMAGNRGGGVGGLAQRKKNRVVLPFSFIIL